MSDEQMQTQILKEIDDISKELDIRDYQAFPRWVCSNVLGIRDETVIDEAVAIDGAHDYGIDIFYIDDTDEAEQCMWITQIKFSKTLDHVVTREEILSFRETLKYLEDCPADANSVFKQKSMAFNRIKQKNPHIKKIMLFAVTGTLNDQAKQIIQSEYDNLAEDISIQIVDLNEILSYIRIPRTPNIKISFDGNMINRKDPTTKKKSIIGYVNTEDLIKSIKPYKRSIYLENPREYLGITTSTNKAIIKTICDENLRKKFWKLNNGITAICDGFDVIDEEANTFIIKNFKVVNGRQTTSTLEKSTQPIDEMFVTLTIHETVDSDEHNLISQTTNTQNPIKPIDLITNSKELRDLVSQCKERQRDFYFERQTSGFASENISTQNRITTYRVLEKNASARAYYAYAINPYDAIMSDKDLFSLTEPIHYDKIFKNRNIEELVIPHIFMKTLGELCSNWRKASSNSNSDDNNLYQKNAEIFSKKITKYFVLRFINLSMTDMQKDERNNIEKKIIEIFQKLKKRDKIPDSLLKIVNVACESFMTWFNSRRYDTWPAELIKKISSPGYKMDKNEMPTPYDIMYKLKENGPNILFAMMDERGSRIRIDESSDLIKAEILKIKDL